MAAASECYDVVVVGRGMLGSSAASHLARRLDTSATEATGDAQRSSSAGKRKRVAVVGPGEPASWGGSEVSGRTIFGAHYDEGRITRKTDPDRTWASLAAKSIDRASRKL